MKTLYQIILAGVIVAGAALLVAVSPSAAGATELPTPVATQACPEGTVPGWLDGDGVSHGCVRDGVPMEPVPCTPPLERINGECSVPPIKCPEGTTPIYTDGNTEGYIEGCTAIAPVTTAPSEEPPVPVEPSAPVAAQPIPTPDTIPAGENSSSYSPSSEEDSSLQPSSLQQLAETGADPRLLIQSALGILILGIIVVLAKLMQKEDHK